MGKKKPFIRRREGEIFKLVPSSSTAQSESESFKPSKEHLEEQHKYGVFYDDDYNYMQHLRDVNETGKLEPLLADESGEEVERAVIRVPPSLPFQLEQNKKAEFFDEEISNALEEGVDCEDGGLEDNFVELAGGIVEERLMLFRGGRRPDLEGVDDEEDFEDEEFEEGMEDYLDEEEGENELLNVKRDKRRDIDEAFDKLLEQDYHNEQVGELDGGDERMAGWIEPEVGQLKKMVDFKIARAKEDDDFAKQYVREKMRLIEQGIIKENERTEVVEVDECSRKRMKWDCESFVTHCSTAYNQPYLIKDRATRLSRKALKKLDAEAKRLDEEMEAEGEEDEDEDIDMDDDDNDSQCTTLSTVRIKGETPEQRRLRKQAVKEAKRFRRQEKKANKMAFAQEHRKIVKGRVGQIKTVPIA
ncbi:hypothetical protein WR25_16932 [Diploscapter pachys]|uniref:Protein LTV1 homolog n=1 Tax=Diploscapter pachys TaxID=2018661 RepID=A0A2A2KTQ6_9BILA|nr:hypothetical protein WR25_16932 [Diploscapter pachys]